MVLGFDSHKGRLEAWATAAILSTSAAIGTGWCLNSRIPLIKIVAGAGAVGLGGMALIALEDCRDAKRYQQVERETEYQQFVGTAQGVLRNTLNYLLTAAPPAAPPQQLTKFNFAALPPGEEKKPILQIQRLIKYPSVRVTGPQGAGKSRLVEEIVKKRLEAGYKAIVIDPHAEYGQWEGLTVIGKGQDYKAIEQWITSFIQEIKDRYHRRATEPNYNPHPITIVCEELTGWKKNGVKNAGELEIAGYSDTRKIKVAMIFVAHGKTSDLMGGAKGMAKTRENGAADLELFAQIDERTGDAVPKMEGILTLPGQEPQQVNIPPLVPLPPGAFKKFGEAVTFAPTPAPAPADSDNVQNRFTLNKLEQNYSSDATADAIPPLEWEIIGIGIQQSFLTIREVQRSAPGRRLKLNADDCAAMFQRWTEFNIGIIEAHQLQNGKTQIRFVFSGDC